MIMQEIEEHLQASSRNSISITGANGVRKQKGGVSKDKYLFTQNDILKEANSIENFIKSLSSHGFGEGTIIQCKAPNGSTTLNIGDPIVLKFSKPQEPKQIHMQEANANTQPNGYSYKSHSASHYPNNFGMGSASGYVHPAVSQLEIYKGKLELSQQELTRIKEEYFKQEREIVDLKSENSKLQIENKTIQQKSDLELQQRLLEQKGFMDSEAGKELMKGIAPALVGKMVPTGAPTAMGNPNLNLSPTKQQFVEFVKSPKISDADIEHIYLIIKGMRVNNDFNNDLVDLMAQHGIINIQNNQSA